MVNFNMKTLKDLLMRSEFKSHVLRLIYDRHMTVEDIQPLFSEIIEEIQLIENQIEIKSNDIKIEYLSSLNNTNNEYKYCFKHNLKFKYYQKNTEKI